MNRIVVYAVAAIAIAIPAVLLGSTLFASEEDQLEAIVESVERDGLTGLLDAGAFDAGGLLLSAGHDRQRFDGSGRAAARALLERATGIEASQRLHLRQHQISVRDRNATAVVNVEVDDGAWVALRLELSRHDDQWLVETIRVMG